jgi:hypothetical protein
VVSDYCYLGTLPTRVNVLGVIEKCAGCYVSLVAKIDLLCHLLRSRIQFTVPYCWALADPGELTLPLPTLLDNSALGLREPLVSYSVHYDIRHGDHTTRPLIAGFEIDILSHAFDLSSVMLVNVLRHHYYLLHWNRDFDCLRGSGCMQHEREDETIAKTMDIVDRMRGRILLEYVEHISSFYITTSDAGRLL